MAFTPVRHPPELLAAKRLGDIVASVIGIILTGPIMLACALLIRLTSRGPILFRQQRSGLNGRAFVMYKFRTMQRDAENRRAEIAHLNESDGPVFKIRRDPRITRIGGILRRWSLDELPQLFNVLKGDMSTTADTGRSCRIRSMAAASPEHAPGFDVPLANHGAASHWFRRMDAARFVLHRSLVAHARCVDRGQDGADRVRWHGCIEGARAFRYHAKFVWARSVVNRHMTSKKDAHA